MRYMYHKYSKLRSNPTDKLNSRASVAASGQRAENKVQQHLKFNRLLTCSWVTRFCHSVSGFVMELNVAKVINFITTVC